VERDYREWDNFSHSPQGKHYLTLLQSELMKSTVEEGNSYTTLTSYTIEGHRLCVPDIVGWKHFSPTNYDNSTKNRSCKTKNF